MSRTVFVLNGPNLNLLGKRQPHMYGYETLADVERDCVTTAAELKLEVRFHQSNREHELSTGIHEARETAGGIVMNPAAFKHTSVAILDALNACEFPTSRCTFPMCTSARRSATILMYRCVRTALSRG